MTNKDLKFAENYIACGNAKQSAIAAGYSEKTAEYASNWLNPRKPKKYKPELADYIKQLSEEQQNERILTAGERKALLSDIAKGGMLDADRLRPKKYFIWCAQYNVSCKLTALEWDLWQYTSKGSIDGISGNVDISKSRDNRILNIAKFSSEKTANSDQEQPLKTIMKRFRKSACRRMLIMTNSSDFRSRCRRCIWQRKISTPSAFMYSKWVAMISRMPLTTLENSSRTVAIPNICLKCGFPGDCVPSPEYLESQPTPRFRTTCTTMPGFLWLRPM